MFSRLTDLGKNLSEEISRINDEVKSSRTTTKNQVSQEEATRIMKLKTPALSSIVKPDEIESTSSEEQTGKIDQTAKNPSHLEQHSEKDVTGTQMEKQENEANSGNQPAKNQNLSKESELSTKGNAEQVLAESDLPKSVVKKLEKFDKYERLYPRLYDAYKVDKAKLSIVNAFEKAMRENTPCDGISDVNSFLDYLASLHSKSKVLQKALNDETKKSASFSREKKVYAKKLEIMAAKNNNLQKNLKGIESKLDKLSAENLKLSSAEEERIKLQETVTPLKDKIKHSDASTTPAERNYINRAQETDTTEYDDSKTDSVSTLKEDINHLKDTLDNRDETIKKLEGILGKIKERQNVGSDEGESQNQRSSLEDELEINKTELEMLRVRNAEALKDYERTKKSLAKKLELSLSENKKVSTELHGLRLKFQSTTTENHKFTKQIKELAQIKSKLLEGSSAFEKQITELKKENEDLHKKLSDLQRKSEKMQDLENEERILSSNIELKSKELDEKTAKINELLKTNKEKQQKIDTLNLQLSSFQDEQKSVMGNKNKLLSDLERSKQKQTELTMKVNKVIANNNRLIKEKEELKDKYENLKEIHTGGQGKIENLKRRLDEVLVDKKEFEDRIDTLEDNLSQTRALLQERTRDASKMRKLLEEGNQDRNDKYRLLSEQITDLKEQKEKVDDAHMVLQREMSTLKDNTRKEIKNLQSLNAKLKQENSRLNMILKADGSIKTTGSGENPLREVASLANNDKFDELQKILAEKDTKIRNLENMTRVLQKANNESNQKLVALNRKLRSMSQQFRRRSSAVSMSSSSSMSRSNDTTTQSILPDKRIQKETVRKEEDERAIYIRNVLFGFLENKEQRDMLLPVMKTLLAMSDEDEKKFLKLLSKV